jgi:FkbM family methyltransferase
MLATAGHLAQTRDLNRLPQITVLPFALGSEAGISVAELPTTRGMVDSTLAGQVASERFLSSSLDFLWPQVARKNLTMSGVKMDVQGMELDVLSGMSETIRRHRPKLVVEIHAGVDRSSFLELIASYGYSKDATPIEPVPGETAAAFVDNRSYAFSMA